MADTQDELIRRGMKFMDPDDLESPAWCSACDSGGMAASLHRAVGDDPGGGEIVAHRLGSHALINCDAFLMLPALPEGQIDAIVTSPPYNLNVRYNTYNDHRDPDEFLRWCRAWLSPLKRALKPDGSLFLNVAGSSLHPMLPYRLLDLALDVGFRLQNQITWVKSVHIPVAVPLADVQRVAQRAQRGLSVVEDLKALAALAGHTFGHCKPINSPRFVNRTHEFVFHLTHNADVALHRLAIGVPYSDPRSVGRWKTTASVRCPGNTWFIPYPTRNEASKHPATFPVELAEQCLRLHFGGQSGLVLDPFSGTGTTSIAAAELGLRSIGIELDTSYHRMAVQRLAQSLRRETPRAVGQPVGRRGASVGVRALPSGMPRHPAT